MKEKRPFIIQFVVGLICIGGGLLTHIDYYSTLLLALGFGFACSSLVQIARLVYWQNPKRQTAYEEKKQEAHINSIDERKQYLRLKAGYATYQIMTFALLLLAFVFALFRVNPWVIGIVFLLFLCQWLVSVMAYRILEKRI